MQTWTDWFYSWILWQSSATETTSTNVQIAYLDPSQLQERKCTIVLAQELSERQKIIEFVRGIRGAVGSDSASSKTSHSPLYQCGPLTVLSDFQAQVQSLLNNKDTGFLSWSDTHLPMGLSRKLRRRMKTLLCKLCYNNDKTKVFASHCVDNLGLLLLPEIRTKVDTLCISLSCTSHDEIVLLLQQFMPTDYIPEFANDDAQWLVYDNNKHCFHFMK